MIGALVFCIARPDSILDFATRAWRKDDAVRIEDAYKWLFHATLGGEHAVSDISGVRAWMSREWVTLGTPFRTEPLEIPLTPDGKLLRVNLRPYRALGGDPEMLTAVFYISAERFRSDKSVFVRTWRNLGKQLRNRRIGHLAFADWRRLDRETSRLGYPAIEHSKEYLRRRKPAYRVVLRDVWCVGQ